MSQWALAQHRSLKTQLLPHLHNKYGIDKARWCLCKSHYIDCLIKQYVLTIHLATLIIPRRQLRKMKSCTILDLFCVLLQFLSDLKNWMFRHFPICLTCILSDFKTRRFQSYCYTSYSEGVVTQILILKNSNDMYIQSMSISSCNSIKTFDLCTLYTTISYSKLIDVMKELLQRCFINKNGQRACTCMVLGRDTSYFVKRTPRDYRKVLWNWY